MMLLLLKVAPDMASTSTAWAAIGCAVFLVQDEAFVVDELLELIEVQDEAFVVDELLELIEVLVVRDEIPLFADSPKRSSGADGDVERSPGKVRKILCPF